MRWLRVAVQAGIILAVGCKLIQDYGRESVPGYAETAVVSKLSADSECSDAVCCYGREALDPLVELTISRYDRVKVRVPCRFHVDAAAAQAVIVRVVVAGLKSGQK